jgi:hypothetical protein
MLLNKKDEIKPHQERRGEIPLLGVIKMPRFTSWSKVQQNTSRQLHKRRWRSNEERLERAKEKALLWG